MRESDVILVIGANPTDAHPVFASMMKKRLREGARLIVADPRAIDLVKMPHVVAAHHLQLRPGTNVALLTALAHVVVTQGLANEAFVRERCDWSEFQEWASFVADPRNSPEATEAFTGVPAAELRAAARLYATGGNAAIYYGLGVTEHSQGTTTVMAIANLAMATGNIGRRGVGVNPLRGQNNVQGSCDMGSFPHEFPGYRHISDDATRASFEALWNVKLDSEPGLRIPNMLDAAVDGSFKALYIQGEDIAQSDPDTQHVVHGLEAMECVVVQDLFLNETANFAHVFLPGSTFLEKDGTFTNAERRISPVRKVMPSRSGMEDWEITMAIANAMGFSMAYGHPSEIMDEIAALTPTFAGVSFRKLDELGSVQWPCNEKAPEGTPIMHVGSFVRGKGHFVITEYVPTEERTGPRFPLLLTTGRILSQYNVGTQTRRTGNSTWHEEDVLEIHPHDAEQRGIVDGSWVKLQSRSGETALRARITIRVCAGRRLYHLSPPRHPGQCHHHRIFGLGDQLPGIQSNRSASIAFQRRDRLAGGVPGTWRTQQPNPGTGETDMTELPPAARRLANRTFNDGREIAGARLVPEETPIAISYGRDTHAVMLATPADLEDFAIGFSLNEGVVERADELNALEIVPANGGIELRIDLAPARQEHHERRRRSLAGPTGCGMCGLDSLAEVMRPAPAVRAALQMSPQEISAAMEALTPAQVLNRQTRAVHGAAFWTPETGIAVLREDVGRHNALDKLCGALAGRAIPGGDGAVLLTSRVSLEMVQKTARLGAGILIAVSAPTALAIRAAEQCGLTLIAVARMRDFEIFTHPGRVREHVVRYAG